MVNLFDEDTANAYNEAVKQYEQENDAWWNSLSETEREDAFYAVVKRIHDGEIKQQGSYRYILYDVFGFDMSMYGRGMDCGFLELHNRIMSEEEEATLLQARVDKSNLVVKQRCKNKLANGVCPLPNTQCNYPDCEKL